LETEYTKSDPWVLPEVPALGQSPESETVCHLDQVEEEQYAVHASFQVTLSFPAEGMHECKYLLALVNLGLL
jgi:hypothetical protein